jgi:hypothetical protein
MNRRSLMIFFSFLTTIAFAIESNFGASLAARFGAPVPGVEGLAEIDAGFDSVPTEAMSFWGKASFLGSLGLGPASSLKTDADAEASLRKDFNVFRLGGTASVGWENNAFEWAMTPRASITIGTSLWSVFTDHSISFSAESGGFKRYGFDLGTFVPIDLLFLKPMLAFDYTVNDGEGVASAGPLVKAELFISPRLNLEASTSFDWTLSGAPQWSADAMARVLVFLPAGLSFSTGLSYWFDSFSSASELSADADAAWAFGHGLKVKVNGLATAALTGSALTGTDPFAWEIKATLAWSMP